MLRVCGRHSTMVRVKELVRIAGAPSGPNSQFLDRRSAS